MTPAPDRFHVARLRDPLAVLGPMRAEARDEGFHFLERLVREWDSGANRFGGDGETLVGAWLGEKLVGIGGLNHDPYVAVGAVGRLRHVYVMAAHRRTGVGQALVRAIVALAGDRFARMRLRAASAGGAAFYERLGFARIDEQDATHAWILARTSKGLAAVR